MFFAPMLAYAAAHGVEHRCIDELVPESGATIVCNADYLTPDKVRWFADCDCRMIGFSCIDSAWMAESLRHAPELALVDRVFMVTGVQNTNFSNATVVDGEFNIRAEQRRFLPDGDWATFDAMCQAGRLLSLPYVPWHPIEPPARLPFGVRNPSLLFRGGNHLLRVLAYYEAVRRGIADPTSGFQTSHYFGEKMNPQFRYCDDCRRVRQQHGRYPFTGDLARGECSSPAVWGEQLDLSTACHWNNRCPKSFYWLASKFADRHGPVDMGAIENAMNFSGESARRHLDSIGRCRFYADAKWEFSINAAQRFWEAAAVGTINLIPRRSNDQDYFPAMRDGEHYLTFSDDFSDLTADIDAERFDRIADNAYALWEQWIKPSEFAISTNLLRHIFKEVECVS